MVQNRRSQTIRRNVRFAGRAESHDARKGTTDEQQRNWSKKTNVFAVLDEGRSRLASASGEEDGLTRGFGLEPG